MVANQRMVSEKILMSSAQEEEASGSSLSRSSGSEPEGTAASAPHCGKNSEARKKHWTGVLSRLGFTSFGSGAPTTAGSSGLVLPPTSAGRLHEWLVINYPW